MKRLVLVLLTFTVAVPLGGCIVHTGPRHGHGHAHRACKPSQHWDGHQCRHNGKGRGARKHDDR
ncbi:MAG: hypothetical protein H6708_00485 [Kofleriaceae bacterium]|nr:hypothetical protein [Myxococcales bacterium]MCB9558864.1 hypothetical protein [Kofleriaceae bacterium]